MQSVLRTIILTVGILLLVTALAVFGRDDFQMSRITGPAVIAILGISILGIGLCMPRSGLWRRDGADEHPAGSEDLHRASFLVDDRGASSSVHDAD